MTTVGELKRWLAEYPDDTEVQVVSGYTVGYESGAKDVPLVLGENTSYFDFTAEVWAKMNKNCYGRKILVLGDVNG